MKAIIVAAGRGKRLGVETDGIPKCMVKVGGKSILQTQVDDFTKIGVKDITVVRGFRKELLADESFATVDRVSSDGRSGAFGPP